MKTPLRLRCVCLAGALLVGACSVPGQNGHRNGNGIEPRWLRLSIPEISLGMEAEGLMEEVRVGGGKSTHEQLSLVPLIGLRTHGSVYHPKLVAFDLDGEAGWGWLTDRVSSGGSETTRHESQELLRYLAQVNFLSSKPYNATFSASQDHTYRDYDSFSTYTVDSTRYGGRVSWTTDTLSLNADAGYREEQMTGLNGTTEISETFANFHGTHKRKRGQSTLFYRFSEFSNLLNFGGRQDSVSHTIGGSDSETFGRRDQVTTTTGASYSQYEYTGNETETITANESITVHHRPKLDSYLNFNLGHSRLHPVTSTVLQGEAGVRHRLYDSLTSTLEVHGSYDRNSGPSVRATNSRYGVGVHENYTKRLSTWGRLSLGGSFTVDHEEHDATGLILTVFDEPHTIYLPTDPDYRPVFLRNPRVLPGSVVVRGPRGYAQRNVDYELVAVGELTELRLIPTSVILLNKDEISVTYESESLFNAEYEAFNGSAQVRLDLFNRLGLYGRLNWLEDTAPEQTLTQRLTDWVGGVDFNWRWLRTGAEYEDYDSNFTQYEAWRFFQNTTFPVSESSTLGFDFSQSFYRYPDGNDQDRYQFLTRLNTQLTRSVAWYVEGGYSIQNVAGADQDYGMARTGLTWTRGKLSMRTGYDYNYQSTRSGPSTEQRDRHHFFACLKRTF